MKESLGKFIKAEGGKEGMLVPKQLVWGEETLNVGARLPKHLVLVMKERSYREMKDFKDFSEILRRAVYYFLSPQLISEAGNRLASEGYPLGKTGEEREDWLVEKLSVEGEWDEVRKALVDLIAEGDREMKSYERTLEEIQKKGREKYSQAHKIVQKVRDGRMDRKKADGELRKILGWGLEEHETRLGLR